MIFHSDSEHLSAHDPLDSELSMTYSQIVEDIEGRQYRLGSSLGVGGQGEVFRVEGANLAVKLVRDQQDPSSLERWVQSLEFVKRLPLDDVAIARPLVTLRAPSIGYVMEFLVDMAGIGTLTTLPKAKKGEMVPWYAETGGLRRRLRLLARTAEALAQLHSKGLVYADLSSNNVFVSKSRVNEEVFLIDADNLRYISDVQTAIMTEAYGAPELFLKKAGNSTLTDAFSFAILAYKTLSLAHPFHGDMVDDGVPEEMLARADRGELPWIDHPDDTSNRQSRCVPREYVLSPVLRDLFHITFVDGLHQPKHRPGVARWADALFTASDFTLQCPRCKNSFFVHLDTCPWCQARRPSYVTVLFRVRNPGEMRNQDQLSHPVAGLVMAIPGELEITDRHIVGRLLPYAHQPRLEIKAESGKTDLQIRLIDDFPASLRSDDGSRSIVLSNYWQRFPKTWRLHLGEENGLHRVITLRFHQDGHQ